MDTCGYGRIVYLLLAIGAFVTALVGGVVGYGTKHSAVPWEAEHMDTTKSELSLDAYAKELQMSPDIDRADWPNLRLPLVTPYEVKILQPDQKSGLRSNWIVAGSTGKRP